MLVKIKPELFVGNFLASEGASARARLASVRLRRCSAEEPKYRYTEMTLNTELADDLLKSQVEKNIKICILKTATELTIASSLSTAVSMLNSLHS